MWLLASSAPAHLLSWEVSEQVWVHSLVQLAQCRLEAHNLLLLLLLLLLPSCTAVCLPDSNVRLALLSICGCWEDPA
jgi:hypothetical protein